jgi:hypothetical protein
MPTPPDHHRRFAVRLPRVQRSDVLAVTAIVLSLSGTAYAAATVTGREVRNGSLTSADVRDRSLRLADVRTADRARSAGRRVRREHPGPEATPARRARRPAGRRRPGRVPGAQGRARPGRTGGPAGPSGTVTAPEVRSSSVTITADLPGGAVAECEPGEMAISGGFAQTSGARTDVVVFASEPLPPSTGSRRLADRRPQPRQRQLGERIDQGRRDSPSACPPHLGPEAARPPANGAVQGS